MSLYVLRAAICQQGKVYDLPRPARHRDILHHMVLNEGIPEAQATDATKGFLLSDGTFADRVHAAQVALQARQLLGETLLSPPRLFSEDVW